MYREPKPADRLALLFEYLVKQHKPGQTYTLGELILNFNALASDGRWDVNRALEVCESKTPEEIGQPYTYTTLVKADPRWFESEGLTETQELDTRLIPEDFWIDVKHYPEKVSGINVDAIREIESPNLD